MMTMKTVILQDGLFPFCFHCSGSKLNVDLITP